MNYKELFKKIYQTFSRAGRVFWARPYLCFTIFLLLDGLIFALFFWHYCLKPTQASAPLSAGFTLNIGLLDNFILDWQTRQAAFDTALTKQYPDLFTPLPDVN